MFTVNRDFLRNWNGIICGTSKSKTTYCMKKDIMNQLNDSNKVFLVDLDGSYKSFIKEFDDNSVQIIDFNNDASINPFDLPFDFNSFDELALNDVIFYKADFANYLFEELLPKSTLTAMQKSLLDSYINYLYKKNTGKMPTLSDLFDELFLCPKLDAAGLNIVLEEFLESTDSLFNKKTNLLVNDKLTIFDLSEIDNKYKIVVAFIVLEYIWNYTKKSVIKRHTSNSFISIQTYLCGFDNYDFNVDYVNMLFKCSRKYASGFTYITNNISKKYKNNEKFLWNVLNCCTLYVFTKQSQNDYEFLLQIIPELQQYESYLKYENNCGVLYCCSKNLRYSKYSTFSIIDIKKESDV